MPKSATCKAFTVSPQTNEETLANDIANYVKQEYDSDNPLGKFTVTITVELAGG